MYLCNGVRFVRRKQVVYEFIRSKGQNASAQNQMDSIKILMLKINSLFYSIHEKKSS